MLSKIFKNKMDKVIRQARKILLAIMITTTLYTDEKLNANQLTEALEVDAE